MAPIAAMPALETQTSMPPHSATTSSTAVATASGSVMSQLAHTASPMPAAARSAPSRVEVEQRDAMRGGQPPRGLETDAVSGARDDGNGTGHGRAS